MKIRVIGAAAVLIGALAACSGDTGLATPLPSDTERATPSPTNTERATDPPPDTARYASNGVTFDYPTSWQEKEQIFPDRDTLWQFRVGPPGKTTGYVEILAFRADHALRAAEVSRFAEGFFGFIQSDAAGDRPEGDVEQTSVAGVQGLQMRWLRADGAAKRAVVFADGDLVYTIDCYISPEDAAQVEDACAAIVGSFAFSD